MFSNHLLLLHSCYQCWAIYFKARWPPLINIKSVKGYQTTRLTVAVDFGIPDQTKMTATNVLKCMICYM